MHEPSPPPRTASPAPLTPAERVAHWDAIARRGRPSPGSGAYHRRLAQVYRFLIPPGQRVLELGAGSGRLLAALEPSRGVGVDVSAVMVEQARRRFPELTFAHADAHDFESDEPFDFVVLSDLVNDLWDVQQVFERVAAIVRPGTRVVMNFYSRLWQLPLALAARLRLATPVLDQNWLTVPDVDNLLRLVGLETLRTWPEILLPLRLPPLDLVANQFVVKLWPFRNLALTNFLIAAAEPAPRAAPPPVVSVIVPARNEAGNVDPIFDRTPELGAGTELIFVEGHSQDDTYAAIERAIAARPERRARLLRQTGRGKGDAVRLGFAEATGDVLMILDADLTVAPEDLPRFYRALACGRGEFVNGVRLVYPMEERAMRFINLVGNKFFSLAFSWLLGQPIKDTLCGTKVLWRRDYERIAHGREYFGDFDPFGDFDLVFGAAKLNLKLVDLPIRYRERTYGTTNIRRWRHGLLLLRMLALAAVKLKFV